MKSLLQQTELIQEMKKFEKRRKNNVQFQLIYWYMKMVERLLPFRYVTRSDDWLLHLKSTEEIIPDIISMDRIKYRRMSPVYLADMKREPSIWESFIQGKFTVKKNSIPLRSLGADHAGEQQNKLLKIQGDIIVVTKNEKARLRHFLFAPVLAKISHELENHVHITSTATKHHRLKEACINKQSKDIQSLKTIFIYLLKKPNVNVFNMITNVVYSDETFKDILSLPEIGRKVYVHFCEERFQVNSKVNMWSPKSIFGHQSQYLVTN